METENKTSTNEKNETNDLLEEKEEQFVEVQLDNLISDDKSQTEQKSDEELWDPSAELDDVSLLDEFAEEIEELEKREKESKTKESDDLSDIFNLDESLKDDDKKTQDEGEDVSETIIYSEKQENVFQKFLPIIISAVSFAFLVVGVYIFLTLYNQAKPTKNTLSTAPPKIENQQTKQQEKTEEKKIDTIVDSKKTQQTQLPHFESLPLSSFIIPAVQNGQLVFLNLQITLLVQDEATKKQILQRETRIRDAIYRELKGVDVSKGVSENTLIMLRKPIIDKLNSELSPLKVEDIRITGYILK